MAKKTPARNPSAAKSRQEGYDRVRVDDLDFDATNPRLVEYLQNGPPTQKELLRILWQQMAVDEIAMSIAASGYFDHEPLFVVSEKGRDVVIEGNRRLAAVKLLLDSKARADLRATDLPQITPERAESLSELPVVRTTRKDAWQYLGFKHVNGPAKWDSYPKAQYIATVHNEYGVPLDEIARQIGDKHRTVQRLYRALMVIKQAEDEGVFKQENKYKGHFSFSHLYTGLDYEGIADFIELKDECAESRSPVPKKRRKELGELCTWLYGDKTMDIPPQVESQNPHLRQLNEVLKSEKAIASLRAGLPLSVALEVSYGDEKVFHSALIQAKEALQKARGAMSTGYRGDKSLLQLAHQIVDLAYDLLEDMERQPASGKRPRPKGPRSI